MPYDRHKLKVRRAKAFAAGSQLHPAKERSTLQGIRIGSDGHNGDGAY